MKKQKVFNICLLLIFVSLTSILISCKNNAPEQGSVQHIKDSSGTVYLVRHAEKMKSKDRDPALSPEGKIRAEKLSKMLIDKGISAIFSTDYDRTRSTAAPLAKGLGIDVALYDPRDSMFVDKLFAMSDHVMLVVGHSNSTPTLVNKLLKEEKYAQLDESEYSKLFKLTLENGTYTSEIIEF